MDLRTRVLKDADAGVSSKGLAVRYHVSRAWVDALKRRWRETGSVVPRKQTTFRRRALVPGETDRLAALATARPEATVAELRKALRTSAGVTTVWRALRQLGFTSTPTWRRGRTASARLRR